MKVLLILMSALYGQETEAPQHSSYLGMYAYFGQRYGAQIPQHQGKYPQLILEEPTAPYFSEDEAPGDETQPQLMQTLVPAPQPDVSSHEELLKETWRLREENKTLGERVADMELLVQENNRLLRALLEATQQTGVNLETVEKNQEQIENDLMGLAGKKRHWKDEIMRSQEHPLHRVLRYLRLGFNVSASTGTAISTYYTFAWIAGVLPAAVTPPGWILISASATTGALYYVLYAL